MSDGVQKAWFNKKDDSSEAGKVYVHFNPASLQYTINNEMKGNDANGGANASNATQYVNKTTAKLDMELVFDTTDSGADVRATTARLQVFLKPSDDAAKAPPVVEFHWGVYSFKGMIESYKETIDFFAAEGVPLRATVNLGLVNQDASTGFTAPATQDAPGRGEPALVSAPNDGTGMTGLGSAAGNPGAGRALASANGMASMRFSADASVAVSASVELKAAAAFSTGASAGAGAGFGIGGGFSAGVGAGAGIGGGASAGIGFGAGASAGFGTSAGAGFSAGAGAGASAGASAGFSASASAGVSASAGAFAGLRSGSSSGASARLDVAALTQPAASLSLSTASFGLGGAATASTSSGLSADVGAKASLNARLSFDS